MGPIVSLRGAKKGGETLRACAVVVTSKRRRVSWPSYVGAVRGALLRQPPHERRRGSDGQLAYLSVVGHLDEC